MLKAWNVKYYIGTGPARFTRCLTEEGYTSATSACFREMIGIATGEDMDQIHVVSWSPLPYTL